MLSAKFLSGLRGLSLGLDVSLIVALLVLPLLAAVILAGTGSGLSGTLFRRQIFNRYRRLHLSSFTGRDGICT